MPRRDGADEPTSGLDPLLQHRFSDIIYMTAPVIKVDGEVVVGLDRTKLETLLRS